MFILVDLLAILLCIFLSFCNLFILVLLCKLNLFFIHLIILVPQL